MLPNFGWILPGRLAGMARPRVGSADELVGQGIGAVLTLTEAPPPAELAERGLLVAHEPVQDFEPPPPETIARCVAFARKSWNEGKAVVVHCHAGYGRTGTVLAALLVAEGVSPRDAIETVRALRPGSVETPEQEEAVLRYARSTRGRRPAAGER